MACACTVTVENRMVQETKGFTRWPLGAEGLLNVQPDDFVFYVGATPSNFTVSSRAWVRKPPCPPVPCERSPFNVWPDSPLGSFPTCHRACCAHSPPTPLRFPGYRGCIELDTLNEEVVSLYNFEKTFQLDTAVDKPCARHVRFLSRPSPLTLPTSADLSHSAPKAAQVDRGPVAQMVPYLDGSGFARISMESQLSNTKRFDQELRLVSYSGIIFLPAVSGMSAVHAPILPPPSTPARHAVHAPACLLPTLPAHLAVLTLPFPQDQFLCLAGKLAPSMILARA